MKQPDIGLWRKAGLRNNYLPLLFAAVLLLSSFCAHAQSYTTVNGRYIYTDSVRLSKLKNNSRQDSVLSTDSSGRLILKFINTTTAGIDITGEQVDNSTSQTITTANLPISNSLKLIRNGVRLPIQKYTVLGSTITLNDLRSIADNYEIDYKISGQGYGGTEVTGETVSGSYANTITLINYPLNNTLKLIKNGMRLPPFKYSVSGGTVTLADTRISADIFESDYKF